MLDYFKQHGFITQTQEIITHRVSKIYEWIWGMCMSEGKFLKEWPMRDKIIEWFFTIHIFILQMIQTQEIINCRVLKIPEWVWGDVWSRGMFLTPWQVSD